MTTPDYTERQQGGEGIERDAFTKDMFADIWDDFTECDYQIDYEVDAFLADAEGGGLIECVPVTEDALEEPFAAERGIEPDGMMWQLTERGRLRYHRARANPAGEGARA